MKGFYIEVTNNLLDPKHVEKMGISVWLFLWFLDKMTSISEEGIGKVLGGKPITYEEVAADLGISKRTYASWIRTLREAGYIKTVRTPYGLSVAVHKAKKHLKRSATFRRRSAGNVSGYAVTRTSNIRQYQDITIDKEGLEKLKGMKRRFSEKSSLR